MTARERIIAEQEVRDAAAQAAIAAWRAAREAARLAALAADLEALGFAGGIVGGILNSPEFTGTPTAPTAADGTNTTQISTTQFVNTAISQAIANLVSTSPAALDTLYELAAALGNDPEFATHVADALGVRLRFDVAQALSGAQQIQARANLGLGSMAVQSASDYLTIANSEFVLRDNVDTVYPISVDDISRNSRVILTSTNVNPQAIQFPTPLSLGITGCYGLTIVQGGTGVVSGVATGIASIVGNAVFTRQNEAKTFIAINSTTWRVLGAQ